MTVGGEIRALVAGAGTTLTETYRQGHVPDDAVLPFASFLDPVGDAVALQGDARTLARTRLVQVDVWTDEGADADVIVDALEEALDGATIASGLRVRVRDVSVVPEPQGAVEGIVHHAITVAVARLR